MAEIEVLAMRVVPSVNPQRLGKVDRVIVWRTEPGKNHTSILPDEGFTDAKLQEDARRVLAAEGQLVGRKLTL